MPTLSVRVTSAGLVTNDKKKLKKVMRAAGSEVVSVARKLLRSGGGGRTYRGGGGGQYRGGYKAGAYTASAPGQPPANVTRTLERSLKSIPYRSGEGVAVRARVFYALMLQAGAKGGGKGRASRNRRGRAVTARILLARPFLTVALDSRASSLNSRIRAAVVDDIAFKRVKA